MILMFYRIIFYIITHERNPLSKQRTKNINQSKPKNCYQHTQ